MTRDDADGRPSEGVAHDLTFEGVDGRPDTIITDLKRADAPEAERVEMSEYYDETRRESTVWVEADDDNALKWLYDWLEESRQYYKENFVDASAEHDAARDLAHRVYEVMADG